MDKQLLAFFKLSALFHDHGFSLYLVGGTVRDYLLNIPLTDMDAVTDATPNDMKSFLTDADYTFSCFGSIKYKVDDIKFDITTLRKESEYIDSRHPRHIEFVKDLNIDVKRRDFTINGLYLDDKEKVIDLVNGVNDLNNKIIKMIGDPDIRIKEDPLRIIRAIRFAIDLDFVIDESLTKAIKDNKGLLERINKDKINMDLLKIKNNDLEKVRSIFAKFDLIKWLGVVE